MSVAVFFHKFQKSAATSNETLGMGIPLGTDGVATNLGDDSFPAFVNGLNAGKWRIAKEFEREFANSDLESRARRWMSGQQLVGVSDLPCEILEPCFIFSDQNVRSKLLSVEVVLNSTSLQNMAGVQMHFLSLRLCEMFFPEMSDDSSNDDFQGLKSVAIHEGDVLPVTFSKSVTTGVIVVESIENQTLRGSLHYVEKGQTIEDDETAVMKFTSEFMGTSIEVSTVLGHVVTNARIAT